MASVLNGPITAFVVVTGLFLNFLSILTLSRSRFRGLRRHIHEQQPSSVRRRSPRRPVIYTYFFWIAYTDSALLVSAMFMYCLPALMENSFEFYVRFFPICYMLSNATLTTSVWLMCAMVYDRYRALSSPMRQRISSSSTDPTKRIRNVCATVLVAGLVYSLPRLFELNVVSVEGSLRVVQTDLVSNQLYMIGYRIVGAIFFYSLFPFVILSVISARVSYAVHRASLRRKHISMYCRRTSNRNSSESERILMAIMAKFLVSRLLPTALDITEHIIGQQSFISSPTVTIAVDICDLIVVVTSSTNFFIYYALSRSFRRSLGSQCIFHCSLPGFCSHKSDSESRDDKECT